MDIEEYRPYEEPENEPRSRRMEMVAGVALFAAVMGFVLFSYVKGEMQVGHYHAGVDALGSGDLDRAIAEFQAADGYLDSAVQIENAKSRIEDRDALYKEATDFASVGKWWQVSRSILDMQGVQAKYKDSDALLARARVINGGIFFTHMPPSGRLADGTAYKINDTPDLDGMFSMQADGRQADQIPNTIRVSQTYALSPDGQSLVYSIPSGPPRVYNFGSGWITQLDLPHAGAANAVQKAIFSPDGKMLTIVTANTVYKFDMARVLAKGENRGPVSQESRPEWEAKQVKALELSTTPDGVTTVGIRTGAGYGESNEIGAKVVAREEGRVDGAIFSKDQNYLMYRVCWLTNGNENFSCSLKLVDLTDEEMEVQTIATVTNLALSSYDEVLLGEFTEDGEHYVVFTNYSYRNISEAVLYNIKTGEANKLDPTTFGVSTGRGKEDVYAVGDEYLVDDYMPGLEDWQGRNRLGRTAQNLQRPMDHYAKVRSHWISVSANDKFVVALGSHITESDRYYRLTSTSLTWNSTDEPEKGRILFSTKSLPREWLPSMRTLGDGYTVVASVTGDREQLPSIRAYNLDKEGQSNVLLMKDARLLDMYAFPDGE